MQVRVKTQQVKLPQTRVKNHVGFHPSVEMAVFLGNVLDRQFTVRLQHLPTDTPVLQQPDRIVARAQAPVSVRVAYADGMFLLREIFRPIHSADTGGRMHGSAAPEE